MSNQNRKTKADALRKSGEFADAVAEYSQTWPDGDPWTGWGYAHSLRKLGQNEKALEIARQVYRLDSSFRLGRSIYAWILYDLYIRDAEELNEVSLKAANAIVSLTNDEQSYEATSAFVTSVLKVAKLWSKNLRDNRVLDWLAKLDVNRLSTESGRGTDERGRIRELASKREQYYSLLTHSLERLGRWQECLDASSRALVDCGNLHHDNDVWFSRRIALANRGLGRPAEAANELERLAQRKDAAFLQSDIAAAAWDAGDVDRTFKHALQALKSRQDLTYKLDSAILMARVLWSRGDFDHAREHLRLCLSVRSENGWKEKDQLKKLASEWEVNPTDEKSSTILGRLRTFWEQCAEELSPKLRGVITRILPSGHAGFIRGDNNSDYYFDFREWRDRGKPTEGVGVAFSTKPGFDRKRNRETTVACDVRRKIVAGATPV